MNRGTVLVVDDDLASLKLMLDTLVREGLRVLPADSGELALASIETTRPDLILLDLEMPAMDGFEVMRRLKTNPVSQSIPVVFLSAATDTHLRVQAFERGAVDFVSKPFERNELLARVNAHIELFHLRCELKDQADALRLANEQLQALRLMESLAAKRALAESDQSRSAAEESLQRERILMAAIVESSGDAIIARGLDGIVASWNNAAYRIFGYTTAEMLGHSVEELIPPERHEEVAMILDSVRQGKSLCDFETERLRKDRTRIAVSLTVSPIRDIAGEVIGVSSIVRDITAQRVAEQALRQSEERWKFALEGSGEGVWDWNLQTGEVQYSRRWKEMLGYAEGDVGNDFKAWEQLVHTDDIAAALATIQAYQSGEIQEYAVEHRMRCKDGGWRWILSRGMIVSHTPEGKPLRMIGTHADITERKESELQVSFMAYHDRLTGLPNRALFFDRFSHAISQARRNKRKVALLFTDLDGFKPVNDLYGHDAGDIVLKVVAARLIAAVRAIDTVARIGGDEFVIILGEIDGSHEAAQVAAKLVDVTVLPITLPCDQTCTVGLSVGISIYPDHGTEMDTLLAGADAAMYQSKTGGKGKYTVFDHAGSEPAIDDDWAGLDDSCRLGVAEIDEQHQQLATMINQLNRAIRVKESDTQVDQLFGELSDFTLHHFATEHELMERFRYPGQASHDAIHGRLMADTLRFRTKLNKGGDLFVLQSLKDWLMQHIQTEDRALGEYLKGKL